jgi:aminoglycoside phosphotransferase (APT) family kinase protein
MFEQFIGTKPVEERHRIDVVSLEGFLGFKILGLEQFKGGQSNPTYRITAADGRRFVLRRKPPGKPAAGLQRSGRKPRPEHESVRRWITRSYAERERVRIETDLAIR